MRTYAQCDSDTNKWERCDEASMSTEMRSK
jgi:hypothetical protein